MATKAKEVAVTTKKETKPAVVKNSGEVKKVVKKTAVKKPAVVKNSGEAKKTVKKTAVKKPAVVKDSGETKKAVPKKAPVKKIVKKSDKSEIARSSTPRNDDLGMDSGSEPGMTDEVKIEKTKVEEKKVEVVKKEYPRTETSIEELFEAGAHFGHVVKKWNPKMKKYLWGAKNGIHIFDLEKTVAGVNEATKALTEMAAAGKRIVLVGTKRQVRAMVEEEAKRLNIPYITQRWMGGLITNWKQLKLTLDRLNSLKSKRELGQLKKYTKKEQLLFDKEINKLERIVGGIASLREAPEVVVVFDTHKEKLAVKEASSRGVQVVGLVDSNANPDPIDYLIPMNDDSAKGLEILVRVLGQAIENGQKAKKEVKN